MKRKIAVINRTRVRTGFVAGVLSLSLLALAPAVDAATIETGFSPEGTALQLVLKTLDSAQQEIRLMGYSFTSRRWFAHSSRRNNVGWMSAWCWTRRRIAEKPA